MDQDTAHGSVSSPPPKPAMDPESNAGRPAANPRNRRIRAYVIAGVLIIGALYVAWRWYSNMRKYVSTDDAMIDANRLNVSSKMLGRIDQLGTDEGDTVVVGQILVRFNASDLLAQSAQARAALALAKENVRLTQISLTRSKNDLDRAQTQFNSQTVTAEQLEHAQSDYETAKSKLSIAQAQVTAAQAQSAVIDTSLTNATIMSPMHGVVSRRWVLPGDVVQPAQPIFSLYDLDSIWVSANLEETKLRRVHVGDTVLIHVDSYPGQEFSGRVVQIGSNTAAQFSLIPPNNASGNFTKVTQRVPVKISITRDSSVSLLPGMSVVVKVKS